ncbi:MAG TPA: S41 family peptidase, partial [Vicinamibacterales bacterium]|nr:S41 family peptidase [Vicinamibacterales bacterium]
NAYASADATSWRNPSGISSRLEYAPRTVSRVRLTPIAVLACLLVVASSGACSLVIRDPFAAVRNPRSPSGATLSRTQAIADLEAAFRALERVHPAPYRFHSREVVGAERQRLIDSMPESLSTIDLCLRISRLLATLDDGHTGMRCDQLISEEWRRAASASPPASQTLRVFPPYMILDEQQRLVVQWPMFVPQLESGDRLLRVNGQEADALLAAWSRETSHDTEAGRRASVARRFRTQLALRGINAPYRVEMTGPGGSARELVIEGEPVNYQFPEWPRPSLDVTSPPATTSTRAVAPPPARAKPATPPDELKTPFFNYRSIAPGVGYMDFFSTLDGLDTEARFKDAVDAMFARVGSDRPRVLIVDIRQNGGGADAVAGEFLRHITEKPFRLLASTQIKRSAEARSYFKSMVRIPFRWMGLQYLSSEPRKYFTGEVGSLAPPDVRPVRSYTRAEPFFEGPVCVLTGPYTFSAAAEFADAVKTYQLATIVGEETGGRPNDFGNQLPFALPNSGLTVNIASVITVRANGDAADANAVTPDIVVRRTAADIRSGFDPALERAKSCPSRSIR